MYKYRICDINVRSELLIPFLVLSNSKNSNLEKLDIKFHNSPVDFSISKGEIIFEEGSVYHKDKFGTIFKITNDSKIIIFSNNNDIKHVNQSIIGIPFGYALSNKGFNVVHGSSVSIGNNAACIFGFSGQGKSTLALSLINKGFKFLTEDLCIFKDEKIYQFNPWVKTTTKLIRDLNIDIEEEVKLFQDSRERNLFKIQEKDCSKKCTPKIAYFIVEDEKKSIKNIAKSEAFEFLFTNFYRFDNKKSSDLQRMTNILESLDFYIYKRDINAPIEENSEYLSSHMKELIG